MDFAELIKTTRTSYGRTLLDASVEQPILLVFLRQFGCIFCLEAIKDIGMKKDDFAKKKVGVIFVHMSDGDMANYFFKKYDVEGVESISDPSCQLYSAFGLLKVSRSELFAFKNWYRGFEVALTKGILPGVRRIGDGFQMPGVFLLSNGEIKESFIHETLSDQPDYDELISSGTT